MAHLQYHTLHTLVDSSENLKKNEKKNNLTTKQSTLWYYKQSHKTIVIKFGPVIDPVKALGHWFN